MVLSMTTYDSGVVSDQHLGHKKPITLQQGRALRDNPLAMFEGAPGAPKLHGRAINIALGNLTGSNAIGDLWFAGQVLLTASASKTTQSVSASVSVGYQLSSNNGASWGGTINLASFIQNFPVEDSVFTASCAGSRVIDMWGYNAIRLVSDGTPVGSLICVRGD